VPSHSFSVNLSLCLQSGESELHVIEGGNGDKLICTQSRSSHIRTEPESNSVPAFEEEIN